ncbi:MAG: hypothetical protein ACI80F_001690 [Natronomonas sp.]|jgi:hypothetical protein|uniref:hypothetical protein n=1 Tax=Natronomonas sp. TaxID=2184060 RepID=UPI003988B07B
MEAILIEYVPLHIGHEVTVPLQFRLAFGAFAGLLTAIGVAPIFVFSTEIREAFNTGTVIITRQPAPDTSICAAVFLASGLILGLVFELATITIERVRPVVVLIPGMISLTELFAVFLIAIVISGALWVVAGKSQKTNNQNMPYFVVTIGIMYGFTLQIVLLELYNYFGIQI